MIPFPLFNSLGAPPDPAQRMSTPLTFLLNRTPEALNRIDSSRGEGRSRLGD